MDKVRVGIVGCGVIGSALKVWLEENNAGCDIKVSDPYKGYNDDLSEVDIVFISIHIPTEDDNTQNLSVLREIIRNLPDVPIYIRTTLIPGTCDTLSKEFNKRVYFLPEFLTERTAKDDFKIQPMVFCGDVELLKKVFVGKEYIVTTSMEAELAKYAHNVFGALKVTYFNGIYELAEKYGCDFENIRKAVFLSGYINEMHTAVPGPDGKFGYGGKCFPKDVNAFIDFTKNTEFGNLIKEIQLNNNNYRK